MIKKYIRDILSPQFRARYFGLYNAYIKNTKRKNYPHIGKHVDLNAPLMLDPNFVTLEDYTRLQSGVRIISSGGNVIVRKYSAIGAETIIIPGNHTPTVGLPQYASTAHINDKSTTIIIEEDCWIGSRCILLSRAHVGRGAVVAAGSTVTKDIPPYAVAAGSPAKIIACRFTADQILAHERQLYPTEERFSNQQVCDLFDTYFSGKRSIGAELEDSMLIDRLNNLKRSLGIPIFD